MPVDHSEHASNQTDSKEIVGISEETDTSDYDSANVVPAEWSFVDFRKSKSATLIGIFNVSLRLLVSQRRARHIKGVQT